MSNEQGELQFETAESTLAAASATCSACRQPIAGSYFTIADQVACERCKSALESALQGRAGMGDFVRAFALGTLGGIAGAALWYGIAKATGYELGLIAIAVGFLVGTGVKKGSRGRGGPAFQVMAVALTYFWITASYVPDIVTYALDQSAAEQASAGEQAAEVDPVAVAVFALSVVPLALQAPFLMGAENAIGMLLIAFALWEAWKLNKKVEIAVAGPFALGEARPASIA